MRTVTAHFAIGVRRAWGLLRLNRASWYYRHHGRDDIARRMRLRELAHARPRFGYLRLHVLPPDLTLLAYQEISSPMAAMI